MCYSVKRDMTFKLCHFGSVSGVHLFWCTSDIILILSQSETADCLHCITDNPNLGPQSD